MGNFSPVKIVKRKWGRTGVKTPRKKLIKRKWGRTGVKTPRKKLKRKGVKVI
jgi:hypothetical protein